MTTGGAHRPRLPFLGRLGALLWLAVAPLRAHDFWIDPSTFRPAAGALVSVRLRVGMQFKGDPVPRLQPLLRRFSVVDGAGERAIPGQEGMDPAGYIRTGPGLSTLVYLSAPSEVELDGPKFEAYLKEEGLEAISARRAKRGDSAKPARDAFVRCAKALLGGGAGFGRVAGLPLELIPERDPARFHDGGAFPVRLLRDGRPLGGALVVAINREDPLRRITARTDRQGRAQLALPSGGIWLFKAVHMEAAPPDTHADWQSLWASLMVELG
ncbi:MAG TPA: DUF4198 domain-containing protein [Holophagaceae bacterium]|nr:DUF4198 domain-containing protein [Holophagaceae bacterium]